MGPKVDRRKLCELKRGTKFMYNGDFYTKGTPLDDEGHVYTCIREKDYPGQGTSLKPLPGIAEVIVQTPWTPWE